MPGRSCNWPRPMLERLLQLHNRGLNEAAITAQLQCEFGGKPKYNGETKAELTFLKTGMLFLPFLILLVSSSDLGKGWREGKFSEKGVG